MRRPIAGVLVILGAVLPLCAQEAPGKLVRETYHAAFLNGTKVGHARTTVRERERDGAKVLSVRLELDLSIRRFNSETRLRAETGNEETPEGKVLAVSLRQYNGDQITTVIGRVDGKRVHFEIENGRKTTRTEPWNPDVVGLLAQERIFQEKQVKPGDTFSFLNYDPSIKCVTTLRATVKEPEQIDVLGDKRKLLPVRLVPDKVKATNGEVALPPTTFWLGDDRVPVGYESELPPLGTLTLYRTTKTVALAKGPPPKNLDIGINSLIPLAKAIPNAARAKGIVYRITVQDDDPTTTFARDARQEVKNAAGKSFELHVRPVRAPSASAKGEEIGDEFRTSCHYITSDNAKVKELAGKAVGTEKDPWRKAQRIERYVGQFVERDNSAPFSGADWVAANGRGDCRHNAMLSAAMCRAAGIPSRTAVGLVYVEHRQRGPALGFHMWTEVAIDGQWLAIDPTQALGSVGADHVKIADHSWHDTQSLIPLLPVQRVLMGKTTIEVLRVEP